MIKIVGKTHKHEGVARSSGALRSHPVNRVHTDAQVQIWHDDALGMNTKKKKQPTIKTKQKYAPCPVDDEGFINIDLDNSNHGLQGLTVKFTRCEGNKRRQVALQINKQ